MFIAVGGISLVVRIFAGSEFTLLPWPIALIVIPIGVFLLKYSGTIGGQAGGTRTSVDSPRSLPRRSDHA